MQILVSYCPDCDLVFDYKNHEKCPECDSVPVEMTATENRKSYPVPDVDESVPSLIRFLFTEPE